MHPAIFIDRDGVIIENQENYVRSWADVVHFPGALSALALLKNTDYKIVIITNQSVVGRGIISLLEAQAINEKLLNVIQENGGRIDGIFMCTHAPPQGCDCRKPQPGLILQAASELSLDISRSFLVGDALTDIKAGQNAGVPINILVKTGRGLSQSRLPEAQSLKPFLIYDRFEDAVVSLLAGLLS
jgi:D-glycero-D-manno-heptose 1,7-bisphosphate phosphatase